MVYNNNYGFNYPGGEDTYNVEDFNENFSKTGNALDSIKTSLAGKAPSSHVHAASSIASGVLPVARGGTGQGSIDTTPTSGSSKMVTSGGVFTALEKKQSKYTYIIAAQDSDDVFKNGADLIYSSSSTLTIFLGKIPEGAEVYFAPGNYEVTTTININKSITITGSHNSVFNSTCLVFYVQGNASLSGSGYSKAGVIKNVTIENITLKRKSGTNDLIHVQNADGIWLKNLTFVCENDVSVSSNTKCRVIYCYNYCVNLFVLNCIFWNNMIDLGVKKENLYAVDMSGNANSDSNFTLIFCNNLMSTYCNVNFSSSAGYNGYGASGNLGFHLYVDYVETSELPLINTLEL